MFRVARDWSWVRDRDVLGFQFSLNMYSGTVATEITRITRWDTGRVKRSRYEAIHPRVVEQGEEKLESKKGKDTAHHS